MPESPGFMYCPSCGSGRQGQENPREFRCDVCNYHYFHNVACAVAAIIVHDAALLATRRAHEPAAGTLDLPGGFVDPGESAEHALLRELAEELALTGLDTPPRYLFSVANSYRYDGVVYATCDLIYRIDCAVRPALRRADEEISALLWLPLATLDVSCFGLASVRAALTRIVAVR